LIRERRGGGVRAAVRAAPGTIEIREFPMPDVPDDAALMTAEVASISGSDVRLYKTDGAVGR